MSHPNRRSKRQRRQSIIVRSLSQPAAKSDTVIPPPAPIPPPTLLSPSRRASLSIDRPIAQPSSELAISEPAIELHSRTQPRRQLESGESELSGTTSSKGLSQPPQKDLFFILPPELRNQIYDLLFPSHRVHLEFYYGHPYLLAPVVEPFDSHDQMLRSWGGYGRAHGQYECLLDMARGKRWRWRASICHAVSCREVLLENGFREDSIYPERDCQLDHCLDPRDGGGGAGCNPSITTRCVQRRWWRSPRTVKFQGLEMKKSFALVRTSRRLYKETINLLYTRPFCIDDQFQYSLIENKTNPSEGLPLPVLLPSLIPPGRVECITQIRMKWVMNLELYPDQVWEKFAEFLHTSLRRYTGLQKCQINLVYVTSSRLAICTELERSLNPPLQCAYESVDQLRDSTLYTKGMLEDLARLGEVYERLICGPIDEYITSASAAVMQSFRIVVTHFHFWLLYTYCKLFPRVDGSLVPYRMMESWDPENALQELPHSSEEDGIPRSKEVSIRRTVKLATADGKERKYWISRPQETENWEVLCKNGSGPVNLEKFPEFMSVLP